MVTPPTKHHNGQPKTYLVSAKNLATLPFRLCNPPPSVGKVRSLSVVPLYKVRLDDVLNRQHLPPLGLKDFEEWLLFVELSPENLYFVLWLREYKRRYKQWKSQIEFKKMASSDPKNIWPDLQYSTHLAMFYARAKQTFFTPGSEYELNLPSHVLSPFHASDAPPHPDPDMFIPVARETRQMLEESLRRFVQGQLSNMGNNRIICGIIVGTLICIIGATPPLTVNFVLGRDRWYRLAALPSLWFGLWLVIASINGVCLGIYLFGDLRQLRQFELARPTISKPVPLPSNRPLRPSALPPKLTLPFHHDTAADRRQRVPSEASSWTGDTARTPTHSASFNGHIQISQAYYDDADEIDESAMYHEDDAVTYDDQGKDSHRVLGWAEEVEESLSNALKPFNCDEYAFSDAESRDSRSVFTATAKFIHPFELHDDEDECDGFERPDRHQRVDHFDFDLLPKRIRKKGSKNRTIKEDITFPPKAASTLTPIVIPATLSQRSSSALRSSSASTVMTPSTIGSPHPATFFPPPLKLRAPDPRAPPPAAPPTSIIARFQEQCSMKRHRLQPGYLESEHGSSANSPYWSSHRKTDLNADTPSAITRTSSFSTGLESKSQQFEEGTGLISKDLKVRLRFKKINAVPPFKAPLTRILSPIIQRGQWEVVVRSAIIGFMLAWLIVGSLLAVPVPSRS